MAPQFHDEKTSHGSTFSPHILLQDSLCILKPEVYRYGQYTHCVQLLPKSLHTLTQHKLKLAVGQQRRTLILQFHFLRVSLINFLPIAKGDGTLDGKVMQKQIILKFWLWVDFFRNKEES